MGKGGRKANNIMRAERENGKGRGTQFGAQVDDDDDEKYRIRNRFEL